MLNKKYLELRKEILNLTSSTYLSRSVLKDYFNKVLKSFKSTLTMDQISFTDLNDIVETSLTIEEFKSTLINLENIIKKYKNVILFLDEDLKEEIEDSEDDEERAELITLLNSNNKINNRIYFTT